MSSIKPIHWITVGLGLCVIVYILHYHLQYFGNVSFLGGILMLEILVASVWKYSQRFLPLLMIAFLWASMTVPLQSAWTSGRWGVLMVGAGVGFIAWTRNPRSTFGSLHLIAFFCVCAAFVSATVSQYVEMATLKALSLLLLFLYCGSGARLAMLGRERQFFNGLLWATEGLVYVTAICYFVFGANIWGNPNSLGAAMAVGAFPVLLWGWRNSDGPIENLRRLIALLVCAYLIRFSMARAGMVAALVVTTVFCLCLRQYKLLVKMAAVVLFFVAISGMLAPETLSDQISQLEDAFLYKGHKQDGLLGSRKSPWENSIASIKEHPMFGTGYGTSPTGEDPGFTFGTTSSSAETEREHGSSYVTIAEWVGLVGVLPFIALLGLTLLNLRRACSTMLKTADPSHYSIPLAMVMLAGLVHANFEDWLFAVGSYLSVLFWIFAFLLADALPAADSLPVRRVNPLRVLSRPVSFGPVASKQ